MTLLRSENNGAIIKWVYNIIMILKKYKTLFVHIDKTGGTSVENALRVYAEDNRVHPKPLRDKHLYIKEMMTPYTAGFFKFSFVRNPWDRFVSFYFWQRAKYLRSNPHPSFRSQVDYYYRYYKDKEQYLSHKKRAPHSHLVPQIWWLRDDKGKVAADFIGRFENLQGDFNIICDRMGVERVDLPHVNKSKHNPYTEYYTDESRETIGEIFAEDIQHFGYKFGE